MKYRTRESLIQELKEIHNNKYEYDIPSFNSTHQKIKIFCKEHGWFEMTILGHLRKRSCCPYCHGRLLKREDVLNECNNIHNNKYDYSLSEWNSLENKVKIICPVHGIFEQTMKLHFRKKNGCPKCSKTRKPTQEEFINKCVSIDNRLDYSISVYKNSSSKVICKCPEHGIIEFYPSYLIYKDHICVKCYIRKKNFENFKNQANKLYENKYDYSESKYIDTIQKIKIKIKETGEYFFQSPRYHLLGKKFDYNNKKKTLEQFIKDSEIIHGVGEYDYSKVQYYGVKDKIILICKNGHEFEQIPNNHLRGAKCPKCNRFDLKQNEIIEFIKENYGGHVEINNRTILNGKEIDIYFPERNLAIEFNGLYWHCEIYKDSKYHSTKTDECLKKGIQLLHIWEDNWDFKKDIIMSMILNKLNLNKNRIYARKTKIKEIYDNKMVKNFLEKNHIQGFCVSKIKLGLFYDDKLVSLMTFGNLRRSLGAKSINDVYEMTRFCNVLNCSVIGGASKLLKYFIENYKPKEIISYSDNSYSNGKLYEKMGFKFAHISRPNYYYVIENERKHRYNYRKNKLLEKYSLNSNKTEVEIMNDKGYYRIWDCGSKKWILKLNK